jgi:hypothetical protein
VDILHEAEKSRTQVQTIRQDNPGMVINNAHSDCMD